MPLIDLSKLKSLIKLANSNNKEHEANAAARKVCEMLAEDVGRFTISEKQPARTASQKVNPPTPNQSRGTWGGVDRSQEPFWKPGDPFYDFFVNFRGNRDPFSGGRRDGKSWTEYAPHVDAPEDNDYRPPSANPYPGDGPEYVRYKPFTNPPKRDRQEDADWITGKRKRRQELRICSKCGLETMTFRTDEVPWICNPCHWKEGKT